MRYKLEALTALMLLAMPSALLAVPVNYSEAIDGDLECVPVDSQVCNQFNPFTDLSRYQSFELGLGRNVISGQTSWSIDPYWITPIRYYQDKDPFLFVVPEGTQVAEIRFSYVYRDQSQDSFWRAAHYFWLGDVTILNQCTVFYAYCLPFAQEGVEVFNKYQPVDSSPVTLFDEPITDPTQLLRDFPLTAGSYVLLPTTASQTWTGLATELAGEMDYTLEFLLSPIQRPVPEPTTIVLFTVGLVGLVVARRRKLR